MAADRLDLDAVATDLCGTPVDAKPHRLSPLILQGCARGVTGRRGQLRTSLCGAAAGISAVDAGVPVGGVLRSPRPCTSRRRHVPRVGGDRQVNLYLC